MTWLDPMRSHLSNDVLERQRDLWIQLATSIERSQAALLANDVGELERRTEEQAGLCAQLASFSVSRPASQDRDRRLQEASDRDVEHGRQNELRPDFQLRMRQIALARARVSRLNRIYAGLLRRTISTARIFHNLLSGSMNTYTSAFGGKTLETPTLE